MLNIVFGSLKTTAAANSAESEFGFASMKLEANRGPKTSRRILFNREAGALLRLPKGAVQKLLFGFAQPTTPDESPRLFVINTDEFLHETKDTTYNTSKNESSFTDSKEKGKAISSTKLSTEIRTFLGMDDDSQDVNFSISLYSDEGEADIYELSVCSNIEEDTIVDTVEETYETVNEVNDIEVVDEEVIVVEEEEIPVVSSGFNVPM
jgi:hypothetical protein